MSVLAIQVWKHRGEENWELSTLQHSFCKLCRRANIISVWVKFFLLQEFDLPTYEANVLAFVRGESSDSHIV